MQIQLNTDNHISGTTQLLERVQRVADRELRFVSSAITRLEVHLNDVNSNKSGDDDIRCMLEARVAGMQPLVAEHRAATIDLALGGAASQLGRLVQTALAKTDTRSKGAPSIRHSGDQPE